MSLVCDTCSPQMNRDLCNRFGIKRSVTSAYHPQTNGLDERMNCTVKTRLSKLCSEHDAHWDTFLDQVAFSIRTQEQASTKYSPFFLMFGRHPRQLAQVCYCPDMTFAVHWALSNNNQSIRFVSFPFL